MKSVVIDHKKWEWLVSELTGWPYTAHVDDSYRLYPVNKTLPHWFLKTRPYVPGSNDCDDRSKYGYCEIHDKHKGTPIVLVRGRVVGFGNHEFMIVGHLDSKGIPRASYCHRLTERFEWIHRPDVTQVKDLW